ncbi:MAG TPA: hypothetical protein VNZ64_04070 [Candidatus Acidoferrum sp.]|jgi:hypothetical protein|nr:hypothetical protein [Candidatus Acidoferrum sp.]
MALDGTARRRLVGAVALLAALGMLVCGQTVLAGRLEGGSFLLYWLFCFGFTFLAMLVALWDARALRHRSRQAERELLHSTLEEIITEAKAREARGGTEVQRPRSKV